MFHKLKNDRERKSYIQRRRGETIRRMIMKQFDSFYEGKEQVPFGHGISYVDDHFGWNKIFYARMLQHGEDLGCSAYNAETPEFPFKFKLVFMEDRSFMILF